MVWGSLLLFTAGPLLVVPVSGFVPPHTTVRTKQSNNHDELVVSMQRSLLPQVNHHQQGPPRLEFMALRATPESKSNEGDGEEENGEKKENPYNDPNYPDLEFVDYSDPEYVVDQGTGDEFFDEKSTEEEIEEMREDRRRRNDEFQFQTYFKELLKEGREYNGEWSVYQTSTFLEAMKDKLDANGYPKLIKSSRPLYVTSKAHKSTVETDSIYPTDAERIHHIENAVDRKTGTDDDDDEVGSKAEEELNKSILSTTYWPEKLSAFDFRGEKGIMCVGGSYTICTTVPLAEPSNQDDEVTKGPFAQYRTEVGIEDNQLRFRIKLDYRMKEDDKEAFLKAMDGSSVPPKLCLKSLVVCRETLEQWPPSPDDGSATATEQLLANALYGKPGAPGGLYDPPPVGSEEQAGKYMLLDLEGGSTILFPYEMDQDPAAFEGNGWVTSLDWTPGRYRYQVDRKIQGGMELRNLRTLELSEVQSADADQYRPKDGGSDMRQWVGKNINTWSGHADVINHS